MDKRLAYPPTGAAGVRPLETRLTVRIGGEGGIRTPGTGFNPVQQISNLPYSAALAPLRNDLRASQGPWRPTGDHVGGFGERALSIARSSERLFRGSGLEHLGRVLD